MEQIDLFPEEEWRIIAELPTYEISSLGRVRRGNRVLATFVGGNGYPRFSCFKNGRKTTADIHRIVALTFLGQPPTRNTHAAHRDGVKTNVALSNIKWASPAENAQDRWRHRPQSVPGSLSGRISRDDLSKIKEDLAQGEALAKIARQHVVDATSLRRLLRRPDSFVQNSPN